MPIREREEGTQLRVPVTSEDWTLGPADAPVTVVEYADFQCPTCRTAHPEVEQLMKALEGKVRVVFRHFPLMSAHPRSMAAALAAEAAGRQGKFWEMHHRLMQGSTDLTEEELRSYAQGLGLDMAEFDSDRQDAGLEARIRERRLEGARSGVNGTPTFFVQGWRWEGDATAADLIPAIRVAIDHMESEEPQSEQKAEVEGARSSP